MSKSPESRASRRARSSSSPKRLKKKDDLFLMNKNIDFHDFTTGNDETASCDSMSLATKSPKFDRKIGDLGKGILCMEYSDLGTGDFRSPSFMLTRCVYITICIIYTNFYFIFIFCIISVQMEVLFLL